MKSFDKPIPAFYFISICGVCSDFDTIRERRKIPIGSAFQLSHHECLINVGMVVGKNIDKALDGYAHSSELIGAIIDGDELGLKPLEGTAMYFDMSRKTSLTSQKLSKFVALKKEKYKDLAMGRVCYREGSQNPVYVLGGRLYLRASFVISQGNETDSDNVRVARGYIKSVLRSIGAKIQPFHNTGKEGNSSPLPHLRAKRCLALF